MKIFSLFLGKPLLVPTRDSPAFIFYDLLCIMTVSFIVTITLQQQLYNAKTDIATPNYASTEATPEK